MLVERRPEIPGPLWVATRTAIEQDVERLIKGLIGVSARVRVVEPATVAALAGEGEPSDRQAAEDLKEKRLAATATEASPREVAPRLSADFALDCTLFSRFWEAGAALLARLPARPMRNAAEAQAAERIKREAREARSGFLAAHVESVYDRLTQDRSRFVRVEQLVYDAASLVPGLVPTRAQVAAGIPAASRQGGDRNRPRDFRLRRAGECARGPPSLPRDAPAASRGAGAIARAGEGRPGGSRRGRSLPQGQGVACRSEESAPPERRGRHHPGRGRDRRGPRDTRPALRNLRAARGRRSGRKAEGATRLRQRNQPHPPVPRQDSFYLVPQARSGDRQQDLSGGRAPGNPARRHHRTDSGETLDRGGRGLPRRRPGAVRCRSFS